jgi:hypothetical protein
MFDQVGPWEADPVIMCQLFRDMLVEICFDLVTVCLSTIPKGLLVSGWRCHVLDDKFGCVFSFPQSHFVDVAHPSPEPTKLRHVDVSGFEREGSFVIIADDEIMMRHTLSC